MATGIKHELVDRLIDAGLKDIEVGSFVRGDRVPQVSRLIVNPLDTQMADTPELLARIGKTTLPRAPRGIHLPVLVPNKRGLENLLKLDEQWTKAGTGRVTDEIALFVSATEVSHYPSTLTIGVLSSKHGRISRENHVCSP